MTEAISRSVFSSTKEAIAEVERLLKEDVGISYLYFSDRGKKVVLEIVFGECSIDKEICQEMLKLINFNNFVFEAAVGYDYVTETYSDSNSLEYHLTRFYNSNKESSLAFNIYKFKNKVSLDIVRNTDNEDIYITIYNKSFDEAKKEVLEVLKKKQISFSCSLNI
ncbi:MAG: hypothetical protein ACP5QP_03800 [Brevinematia bacterium]